MRKRKLPDCNVCGLNKRHADVADCMRDLMDYVLPEIRSTEKFRRAREVGYDAMKRQIAKDTR